MNVSELRTKLIQYSGNSLVYLSVSEDNKIKTFAMVDDVEERDGRVVVCTRFAHFPHWEGGRTSMGDPVNHPSHYCKGKIECIDALKVATSDLTGIEAVCTANSIKYLWRWKRRAASRIWRKPGGILIT